MMILIFALMPLAVILLAQNVRLADRIGVVPLTFLAGFVAAILFDLRPLAAIQQSVAEVSVALALPMIIFAANIRRALRDAKGALTAIIAAFVAVVAASLIGALIFRGTIADLWQVAGMAVGAYTGSGVNMGAVKTALGADQDLFLTMITYDIVFSTIYMAVIVLAGQRLAGLVLRPYPQVEDAAPAASDIDHSDMDHLADDSAHAWRRLLEPKTWPGSALVLAASVLAVGVGVALGRLFSPAASGTVTILTLTTLGLIGSMVPPLHRVRTGFHLGMYLILVFCFASATMLDTRIFTQMDWALGGYFLFVIFGSMALHLLICKIFDIDRDSYLIASGAAIMSVPFIPVIAGALKNRAVLVPGIAVAVLGYALGNYLGIGVAQLLHATLP
ncbi:DUF819 family protein [Paracoccus sp. p3-h83]|uniref:DUF819 family protein n=1 Tax=Paracoccus sp. p3-h83 TaxID=3342805 RepID=UPI0035B6AD03